jgi:molybdopterin-binding protein
MKLSARNQLRGSVTGLSEGSPVTVVVKASDVMLATAD